MVSVSYKTKPTSYGTHRVYVDSALKVAIQVLILSRQTPCYIMLLLSKHFFMKRLP